MYPGKPCFFVEIGKGCTIYKDRPKDPCKDFFCGWIQIEEMPEDFKPEKTGTIMHFFKSYKNSYWAINKAPNNPTEEYLSWAINFAKSRDENILWYIDDKSWWIGSHNFCNQMEEEHKKINLE
jgi:CDP-diacylglycerol pyrophosphatase